MKKMITFFVVNHKLTLVLTLLVLLFGVLGALRLKSQSFPPVDFAMAGITTRYPGATPDEVEIKVTKPIEDEIRKVSGLKDVRSSSMAGKSTILVRVDMDHEDVDEVMSDLQKAIDRVTALPPELPERPSFLELKSSEFPVLDIAITGPNDQRQRDRLADELKDALENIPTVLKVTLNGYAEREFSIRPHLAKLDQHHIGLAEVLEALRARNVNIPAGRLENSQERFLVRLDGKVKTADELKRVIIRSNFTGQKIELQDVATVTDGKKRLEILWRLNGEPVTIVEVTKKARADTIELVRSIRTVTDLFAQHLPPGLQLKFFNDESLRVQNRLDVLKSNAISGFILVIIFLFIFLPGTVGFVASLSLPITLMAVFGFMSVIGADINAITVLALVIALGMLVDNSVVVSENFSRLRREGMENVAAAVHCAHQFWGAITATVLTTIVAFIPMLVTRGIMGEFISNIPIIVTAALVICLGESFFLLPMRLEIMGRFLKFKPIQYSSIGEEIHHKDWFDSLRERFEAIVNWNVRHRYLALLIYCGLIFLSGLLLSLNKFKLFPVEQTEVYSAIFKMPKGVPVEQVDAEIGRYSQKVQQVLGSHYESLAAQSGNSKNGFLDPKGEENSHVGNLTLFVTREASFSLDHIDALARLRAIPLGQLTEVTWTARVNGPPVGDPINATFKSNSIDDVDAVITKMKKYLSTIPGINDLRESVVLGDAELEVQIDHVKLARLGLSVKSVGDTVKAALEGIPVISLTENNRKFDMKLQLREEDRTVPSRLAEIKVLDRNQNLIPLKEFATIVQGESVKVINHYDYQKSKTLQGEVDDVKMTSVMANRLLKEHFETILQKEYPSVSLVFGGQAESTKESMESLRDASILAALGIFAVMVFMFASFLRPLIIMSTIPLGIFGFALAFFLHSKSISFLAMIGVIGLAGIVVNSGIILISFIDELRADPKIRQQLSLHQILVKASGMRLKAVLVTSLTTIGGLIPTAYGIGGTDTILIPVTMAMGWGLTSATLLTLLWIPPSYAILEDLFLWSECLFRKVRKEGVRS